MVVLGVTTVGAVGAIVYSHYAQVRDKAEMRAGVERDKERLRLKRKMQRKAEDPTLRGSLQESEIIKRDSER